VALLFGERYQIFFAAGAADVTVPVLHDRQMAYGKDMLMIQNKLVAIEQGPKHILPKAQAIEVFHRRRPVDL